MALAKKCNRCGKLYEHYCDFNSCMVIVADKYGHIGATSKKRMTYVLIAFRHLLIL